MRKALRIAGIAFAALLALAVAAAAVLAQFGEDMAKAAIAEAVREKTRRTLRIDSPVAFASFWPDLDVRIGGVSLSERESQREFLVLGSARVALAVRPLLEERRLLVRAVEIDGLRAVLVRRKDGTLNIDDLLPKEEGPPPRFDIAGIRVTGGRLAWRDEREGHIAAIEGLALSTGRLANVAEGDLALTARLSADGTEADVKIDARYRYDLDGKTFAPPDIGFEVDIDRLDLDKYLPAARQPAGGPPMRHAGPRLPKALGLHGTVRVGTFRAAGVEARDVKLRVEAADGRLDVAPRQGL